MKSYDVLLFDLDYTLLDFDADMLMAFEQLYRHCGFDKLIPYTPAMLELYEKHNNKWWERFEAGQCAKSQLFLGRFADFLAETGFSGNPAQMNEDYFAFLGQGGVLYPGAEEMLQLLSNEYPLYIITNGNAGTANTRIGHSGIGSYIKDYFVSEAVGAAKPDPLYFEYVFSHIPGFQKERAVVIGDSLASDIQGAQNAGLDSIWYHPDGSWKNPVSVPYTYEAKNYGDNLRILLP